ncbi:MAG: 2-oxo acid dehydrogenase subunit E2 [Desulfobacterales bacterium]|nr:2-oxo acid dehydrogenase subunit E2 [Desulfobacterales bacterium]
MFEFKLPDLGEGIHEGELLKWHVALGDTVKEDDPLCDMETDKAAVTIPSPRSGTIHKLNASPGDIVTVGSVLVVIDDGSEAVLEPPPVAEATPGENNDPESVETPPPPSVNTDSAQPPKDGWEPREAPGAAQTHGDEPRRVIAAPATRRLAREMGIDIRLIQGTGPCERVVPEDLERFQSGSPELDTTPAPVGDGAEGAMSPSPGGASIPVAGIPFLEHSALPEFPPPVNRVPIRSLRRKTAVKTTSSSILVPHVAHMDDVDVTELEILRREHNQIWAQSTPLESHAPRPKLTLMAFFIKAVASQLLQFPGFNSSVDTETMEIVEKGYCHIGFAADTSRGLVVPVIPNAQLKSVAEIGAAVLELAGRGREGKLTLEELTGGTFSVTNVGAIGGTRVFPIINHPETAILGMGRVAEKPVVHQGEIRIRQILPLTLCFDHRVADGAQAALFVKGLKEMLEQPREFMIRV